MTLTEAGGVNVEEVAAALPRVSTYTFGDDTGKWASLGGIAGAVAPARFGAYGGVLACLDELARRRRVRQHPLCSSFWQAIE